jgi:membrane protein implicated in regulation of membrane protease activity
VLTIVAVVLALTVLPSPWGWIAVLGAFAIDVAETVFFVKWSKRRRATVGVETLVGRRAIVVRALAPRGQVRLAGEIWEARAAGHVPPGVEVTVTAVDGLVLDVTPSGVT